VAASQYVVTSDSRLTDARTPTAGSTNYIQNTTPQAGSNFNISGTGTIGGNLIANGNVGIGTTSPSSKLTVSGSTGLGAYVIKATNSTGNGVFGSGNITGILGSGVNGVIGSSASASGAGLVGENTSSGIGVWGTSTSGDAGRFDGTVVVNGNVGIGTPAPLAKLDVRGHIVSQVTVLTSISGTSDSGIGVEGFSDSSRGVYGSSGSDTGVFGFSGSGRGVYGGTGSASSTIAGVWGETSASGGTGVVGNAFGTNSAGVSGIADPSGGTGVYGRGAANGVYGSSSTGNAGYFQGRVTVTGNVCAANISCASDARLKQNIRPLSYGLREVLRLHPVRWQWKDTTTTQLNLGLVAQEVEPVLPELVLRGVDAKGSLGLNYMGLIPVLVKGTQEQQAQIDEQRKHINRQQSQIKEQQSEIEALKKLVCLDHPGADICKRKD